MAAQKGVALKIKLGNGADPEVFTALAGIRSKSLTQNNEQIDVTTDDDINPSGASYRTFLAGIIDFQVSGSGIAKTAASFNALQAAAEGGTVSNYQVELANYGTWQGPMFITTFEVTGELEGAVTFNLALRNAGAVTYTAA